MTEPKDPMSKTLLYVDMADGHIKLKKKDGTVIDLGLEFK